MNDCYNQCRQPQKYFDSHPFNKRITNAIGAAIFLILLCLFTSIVFGQTQQIGDVLTVTGFISKKLQLVADDGTVYDIGETEEGDALTEHVSKRVLVTGRIEKDEIGDWVIWVIRFAVEK